MKKQLFRRKIRVTNFFQAWTEEKNIVFLQDGTVGKVAEKLRVICWDGAPEELINHQYRVFLQDGFSEFEPESEISVRLDNSTFKCLQDGLPPNNRTPLVENCSL